MRHPKHGMLTNSKYSAAWDKLKKEGKATITVFSDAMKSKIIRGISQLKNVDLEWKHSGDNYYLRIIATEIGRSENGNPIIELELKPCNKYRGSKI